MKTFSNLSDQTQNPPRLQIGQALWGMQNLPFNAPVEWTLEEKIARVKDAGFAHLECSLAALKAQPEIASLVREQGMQFSSGHRPLNAKQACEAVEFAADLGAKWVFNQPGSAYHSLSETVALVRAGAELAAEKGIGYFVETHRNNFTETIPNALQLVEAIPNVKITADFSHFVVCGEFYGGEGEGFLERIAPIIERVAHVHGRISNGEQVQVDVGDGQTAPARFFVEIWTQIFKTWRQSAQNGDILPFSSELGPPRYAITAPDGKEISDRWEQALVMRELAREAWQRSETD